MARTAGGANLIDPATPVNTWHPSYRCADRGGAASSISADARPAQPFKINKQVNSVRIHHDARRRRRAERLDAANTI